LLNSQITPPERDSIEDLCKPLSGKVMPKSTLYSRDHTPRSNAQALGKLRATQGRIDHARKRIEGFDL